VPRSGGGGGEEVATGRGRGRVQVQGGEDLEEVSANNEEAH
jgi:hypothetical protein